MDAMFAAAAATAARSVSSQRSVLAAAASQFSLTRAPDSDQPPRTSRDLRGVLATAFGLPAPAWPTFRLPRDDPEAASDSAEVQPIDDHEPDRIGLSLV